MTGPTSFTPEVVRTRRVLGALIIVDQVLTYLGPGIDHGAPTIGAGQGEVVAQFVTIPFTTKVVGSYVELLGLLAFLSWVLLAAQIFRRTDALGRWLGSATAAAAVLACAATIPALAGQVAATYDGHHQTAWQSLGVLNDAAVAAYLAALAVRGAVVVGIALAGLRSRALPRWVGWSGIGVGALGVASPLGAAAGAHQLVFLAESVWMVALAMTLLVGRSAPVPSISADAVAV